MGLHLDSSTRKRLGAFYTDGAVVEFLVAWGARKPRRRVLDPSCGDGRFLEAAARRGVPELIGCDLDPEALAMAQQRLNGADSDARWIRGDFFELSPADLGSVDLVVGNPPYVRYQSFRGETRRRALTSAAEMGVRLTGLTSSWAPFLLHATRFLETGGDLAMVVPAELVHAQYGVATLRGLLKHFGRLRLLGFDRNLFPEAQEETFLLLAEERGKASDRMEWVDVGDPEGLLRLLDVEPPSVPLVVAGTVRFGEALIGPEARKVWHRWRGSRYVRTLGSIGRVVNGYVSGDNGFFHRTLDEGAELGMPSRWLVPAARSAKSLRGLFFSEEDVRALEARGVAHHLVVPEDGLFGAATADALARWCRLGEQEGVPDRYKCRTRRPWWRVPGVYTADVFWSYMIGDLPRVSVNRAGAVFANSLHGVRLQKDHVDPRRVALAAYTSLGLLAMELEGRVYGGGVLKLEPTECAAIPLPFPPVEAEDLDRVAQRVDACLRQGEFEGAIARADELLLIRGLGMAEEEVLVLRDAWHRLVERRKRRRPARTPNPAERRPADGDPA
ncbi:methyltransferase domain-containing protein [Deferrisoma camini]|uniref:methyltransferase domain-containing protein n=1 Tax=Deferrisoma camini TaxID=1035120 RepID=UPI00046D5D67|nr:methyltransferase domain-containing protein [Deferrisoma camini]